MGPAWPAGVMEVARSSRRAATGALAPEEARRQASRPSQGGRRSGLGFVGLFILFLILRAVFFGFSGRRRRGLHDGGGSFVTGAVLGGLLGGLGRDRGGGWGGGGVVVKFEPFYRVVRRIPRGRVNQAVRQLALTRVIVAHRPETIASAGRVIALQEGRVAQDLRSVGGAAPMQ